MVDFSHSVYTATASRLLCWKMHDGMLSSLDSYWLRKIHYQHRGSLMESQRAILLTNLSWLLLRVKFSLWVNAWIMFIICTNSWGPMLYEPNPSYHCCIDCRNWGNLLDTFRSSCASSKHDNVMLVDIIDRLLQHTARQGCCCYWGWHQRLVQN